MRLRLALLVAPILGLLCASAAFGEGAGVPPASPAPVVDPLSVPTAEDVAITEIVGGLEHPWGLAWLPNGDMLVTERPGRLRVIRDGKLLPAPIAGVPEVLAHRQGGLLDVAVDPRFRQNRFIYLSYATGSPEANRTVVARGRLAGGRLTDVVEIFRNASDKSGGQHFGSRLMFLPDETLLVSIGDGGNPPVRFGEGLVRDQAQNPDSHFGKVLRIQRDGSPAGDNPLRDRPDAEPAVWTMGHRNVQGVARDPANAKRIFATEHGAQGGDELNALVAGGNFGWPLVTHAVEYGPERRPISAQTTASGFVDPLLVFIPAIAPSGLAVYDGPLFAAWRGDLLIGGLITGARSNPGSIFRVRVDAAGRAAVLDRIAFAARVRDVRVGPDGAIYALTDAAEGGVFRITPARLQAS